VLLAVLATTVALAAPPPAWAQSQTNGGVTVLAGTGEAGFSGDGGPATNAMLNYPTGVAVARDGTVYISDGGNHRVRAVTPDGMISTAVGSGRRGARAAVLADGARGNDVDLFLPTSLAVGPDGTLYVADSGLFQVFALAPDGRLSVLAGTGRWGPAGDGGPATSAALGQPGGLAVGPDGTVYIGDLQFHRVRAVTADRIITTVAGNGEERFTAAGGDARAVPVPFPQSLAVDAGGAVWIAGAGVMRRLSGGRVSTLVHSDEGRNRWALSDEASWPPGEQPMRNLGGVSATADAVCLLDTSPPGAVVRLGGGNTLDTAARLDGVEGPFIGPIAVTTSGVGYVVDNSSHRVYRFRLAEPATPPPTGDGGSVPWWPIAAATVVAATLGTWWTVRRRRAG